MNADVHTGLEVAGHPDGANSSVSLDLWASGAVDLPGLRLSVEGIRLGFALRMGMTPDGRLGLRLDGPTPSGPEGARAAVGLPGFSGGGFLRHGADGRWRGALDADLGTVAVSGFAVLDLENFSLVVLLAAEFVPPIQLSFGFTLEGVGGLVGINRRADPEALQQALSSGELSGLLFPRDAVAAADRLLPVLERAFPAKPGGFVVGPMVKLGWGTPTIASATVAVLVSDEGTVVAGRVRLALPAEGLPLIQLEATVLGTVTSDGLTVGASLSNSSIVGLPITGDMMLKTRGGADPLFAFSAGGFHPSFTPPEGMAGLRRVGTEISPGRMLRARLGAYLAVTTNSVQFGASAELEAGFGSFRLVGAFAFDALLSLDPFCFTVDFAARVGVEYDGVTVCGVSLSGHLSGPAPWRIRGRASITVLFFDVDIDIPEITWGPSAVPALPPVRHPASVLVEAVGEVANWTVSGRDLPPTVLLGSSTTGAALAHPLAELSFTQSAVPINTELQRMDGRILPEPVTLHLEVPNDSGTTARTRAKFVPSRFRDLDAGAQLSSSGYVDCDAGLVLPTPVRLGETASCDADTPETVVLPEPVVSLVLFSVLDDVTPRVLPAVPHRFTARFVQLSDPGTTVVTSTEDLSDRGVGFAHPEIVHSATVLHSLVDEQRGRVQVSKQWEQALR